MPHTSGLATPQNPGAYSGKSTRSLASLALDLFSIDQPPLAPQNGPVDRALTLTRISWVPINVRRRIAQWLIPKSSRTFEIDLGLPFQGRLDNYIEWVVYVTGDYFEYPYINRIRSLFQGGTALDVGANVGNHALAFSQIFDNVHAVEPYAPVYQRLAARKSVAPRLHTYRLGLSNQSGVIAFEPPPSDNLGNGRVTPDGQVEVQVARGDEFVRDHIPGRVDFIKIDVEGHESQVLEGLHQTLVRDRPVVMFELAPSTRRDPVALQHCWRLFPDHYQFHAFTGQSTFPLQRPMARLIPVRTTPGGCPRHLSDLLCFGRERGFSF